MRVSPNVRTSSRESKPSVVHTDIYIRVSACFASRQNASRTLPASRFAHARSPLPLARGHPHTCTIFTRSRRPSGTRFLADRVKSCKIVSSVTLLCSVSRFPVHPPCYRRLSGLSIGWTAVTSAFSDERRDVHGQIHCAS